MTTRHEVSLSILEVVSAGFGLVRGLPWVQPTQLLDQEEASMGWALSTVSQRLPVTRSPAEFCPCAELGSPRLLWRVTLALVFQVRLVSV